MYERGQILAGAVEEGSVALFMVASITKRAQWPFCSWLPAAIAAPTPVSALVHSSTLVTAGVFLLRRVESFVGRLVGVLGVVRVFTFILAILDASYSYDLKRVVAISTMAHLSLMIMGLVLGNLGIVLFHLCSHALFKALSFLAAGNIILGAFGSQDMRVIGARLEVNPLSGICLIFSLISLSGFPFTSCFFSKDLILESLRVRGDGWIGGLRGLAVGVLRGRYVMRIWGSLSSNVHLGNVQLHVEKSTCLVLPLLGLLVSSL